MADFLSRMARASAERAKRLLARESLATLRARAADVPPAPPLALSPTGFDLIAEIKRRSPAVGALPFGREGDGIAARARVYEAADAAAVSVLTEPTSFDGCLADLALAAGTLATIPAMRKDFLVDPAQLFEARAAGAGGVLLIVRLLPGARLGEMIDAAQEARLFVLVEAFADGEVECAVTALRRRPPGSPVGLVGINTRDLFTLEVDPHLLVRRAGLLPVDLPVVAESGLSTAADVAAAASCGYRAALVGGALMRARDPGRLVSEMLAAGRKEARCPSS